MSEQDIKMLDNMMNSTSSNAVQFDAATEICMLDDELIVKVVTSCCTKVCRVRDVIWTADIAPAEIVKTYEILGIATDDFMNTNTSKTDDVKSDWLEVINKKGQSFFIEKDLVFFSKRFSSSWLGFRNIYPLNDAPFLTFK